MSDMEAYKRKCVAMSRDELVQSYCDGLIRMTSLMEEWSHEMRAKPIYGGVFGCGGFVVASHRYVMGGLDHVSYYVKDQASGLMASRSDTYTGALEHARDALSALSQVQWKLACGKCAIVLTQRRKELEIERQERFEVLRAQRLAEAAERDANQSDQQPPAAEVRSISRRRRRIFDESGGKCHYCATALTLDGKWHIEHKFPRALGGGDEPTNLVASCTPCNHEKRDTTDQEYLAKRAAKGKA